MSFTRWYGLAAKHLAQGDIVWDSDTIKVALTTSAYTPNQDTDEFFSSVTNELAASGGYSAGGVALAGKAHSYDAVSNQQRLTASTTTFPALTPSSPFRRAIIYVSTGVAGTSILLGWVDFGSDQNPMGSDFVIAWSVLGVLTLYAA